MKIKEYRGIRGLKGALLTEDTRTNLSYGDVFDIAATGRLLKAVASDSTTKHYNNKPAIVVDSIGEDTITIDVSIIPLDILAKITGQYYDEDTGTLVDGSPTFPYLAIGYVTTDTDGEDVYVWRLKGKVAMPNDEHATKDNTTNSNGQQLIYTGIETIHEFASIPADRPIKTSKGVNVETAKEKTTFTEETFFATVQDPDKVAAAKKTTAQAPEENNEEEPT